MAEGPNPWHISCVLHRRHDFRRHQPEDGGPTQGVRSQRARRNFALLVSGSFVSSLSSAVAAVGTTEKGGVPDAASTMAFKAVVCSLIRWIRSGAAARKAWMARAFVCFQHRRLCVIELSLLVHEVEHSNEVTPQEDVAQPVHGGEVCVHVVDLHVVCHVQARRVPVHTVPPAEGSVERAALACSLRSKHAVKRPRTPVLAIPLQLLNVRLQSAVLRRRSEGERDDGRTVGIGCGGEAGGKDHLAG